MLLIDEIDKSDIDLPNDLLHVFEEGAYEIPELMRVAEETPEVAVLLFDAEKETDRAVLRQGKVRCEAFPFVVLTSNGERELPPAFLRRCLRLDLLAPDVDRLRQIVQAHLSNVDLSKVEDLLRDFVARRDDQPLAAGDGPVAQRHLPCDAGPGPRGQGASGRAGDHHARVGPVMSVALTDLITAFCQARPDWTVEALADALWLSQWFPAPAVPSATSAPSAPTTPEQRSTDSEPPKPAAADRPEPWERKKEEPAPAPVSGSAGLRLPKQGESRGQPGGRTFRTPAAAALPDSLALVRALAAR